MHPRAYDVFELEGFCIWVNADRQDGLGDHVGVISHEFTHYVQSLSTLHCIDDLLSLLFSIHAGIQRLEDLQKPPALPLIAEAASPQISPFVREFLARVDIRTRRIHDSLGGQLDPNPPAALPVGGLYTNDGALQIKATATSGAPVARLAMMEGAALAKKCEAAGNDDDLKAKMRSPSLAHYFAVHHACLKANPHIDALSASAALCDIALCAAFTRRLRARPRRARRPSVIGHPRRFRGGARFALRAPLQKGDGFAIESSRKGSRLAFTRSEIG
jgi:hypothetical protein